MCGRATANYNNLTENNENSFVSQLQLPLMFLQRRLSINFFAKTMQIELIEFNFILSDTVVVLVLVGGWG